VVELVGNGCGDLVGDGGGEPCELPVRIALDFSDRFARNIGSDLLKYMANM
jgi:hypothetical protein